MDNLRIVQIVVFLIIAGNLVGLWVATDVYDEVHDRIVKVLCLSCIKLDPKTNEAFIFTTVDDVSHPAFVLENLTKGVVFLHYSEDVCKACDEMLPVINEFFDVSYEKKDPFTQTIDFMNGSVTIIYINIDHRSQYLNDGFFVYDKDSIGGLPMFTIITVGYDRGIVKPLYTSLYGKLTLDTDEERLAFLTDVFQDAMDLYKQNAEGYSYP